MRIASITAVAFAAAVAVSTSAGAATFSLYNTGVDALGAPQADSTTPDLHYSLIAPGTTGPTLVRTAVGGYPIPPYIGDDLISAWIGPNTSHDLSGPDGLLRLSDYI